MNGDQSDDAGPWGLGDKEKAKLDKLFRALHDRFRTDFPPCGLWHYTTGEAAKSIIKHGMLRVTNISYLNDATELVASINTMQNMLRNIADKTTDRDQKYITKRIHDNLEDCRDRMADNMFVGCLSKVKDQLSQWRGYGTGLGVALNFDGWNLNNNLLQNYPSQVWPCIYNKNDRDTFLTILIEEVAQIYSARLSGDTVNSTFESELMEYAFDNLSIFAAIMKDPKFSEEQERRVVFKASSKEKKDIDLLPKSTVLSQLIALDARNKNSNLLPLKEMIIGPSDHMKLSKKSMRVFLDNNGYTDTKCNVSSIPFRPLT